jgi:hypothetical protein
MGLFYARNRLRALKNREIASLTLIKSKNHIFELFQGSDFIFQCSQSISRIEKLHIGLFWKNKKIVCKNLLEKSGFFGPLCKYLDKK